MNKPYVKVFDKNGVITNPIKGMLIPDEPNRRQRRASLNYKEPQGLIVYNGGGGKEYAFTQLIPVYKERTTTDNLAGFFRKEKSNRIIRGYNLFKTVEVVYKRGSSKGMPKLNKAGNIVFIIFELESFNKVTHTMPAGAYSRRLQHKANEDNKVTTK